MIQFIKSLGEISIDDIYLTSLIQSLSSVLGETNKNTWVCDGYHDCNHGEDEAKCEIVCDVSKFPCSGLSPNDNTTEFCINRKHMCDGQKDCPKGEDEENCSTKRECEHDTKCKQLCVTTADGKKGCSCLNGYHLASDGYTYNSDVIVLYNCINFKWISFAVLEILW
ncbi:hypothetical protein NQ318_006965 [Aromia moschata]|uniref:Uncharacterized protein n=1 Tax=Aromia moschata TaxID=1265417 RepID=A0AAV8Y5F7_9CUCU|nr:hypothetical protein NQ318_006965 [Aromia moschata]